MAVDRQSVEQIVAAVGSKENINTVSHCVTRLRFVLRDESKVNKALLDEIPLVKGSFSAGGQYQVVIGPGLVDEAYRELIAATGLGAATKEEGKAAAAQQMPPLQRLIRTLADIFIRILPAIVTSGLLMGINNVLTAPGIFYAGQSIVGVHPAWQGISEIINVIANTAFTFLPALIGWSAAKQFGTSELLGLVLGLILVHPSLLSAWAYPQALAAGQIPHWNLFGLPVARIGYQGQVLPILAAAWVLSRVEGFVDRRVGGAFKLLLVGPISLLVTGLLAFVVIGPFTFAVANLLTAGVVFLFQRFPVLGGLVYGALYPLLVVTGMHHTFLAVDLQLIARTGATFLWPILALSNIAQGSAALGMMVTAADDRLRGMSLTSAISAYLGITEPAVFGVNIPYRVPFIAAMIGSAIAAMLLMFNQVRATSIGVGGLPSFLSIPPQQWGAFFIGMAIAVFVPFLLTVFLVKGQVRWKGRRKTPECDPV
jgi:PTS system trehalose-specific IIC component